MRRLSPDPEPVVTDDEFVALYAFTGPLPSLRASMVTSLDGVVVGPDGGSRSISSPPDKRVFSFLRRPADVVMVGAGTMRAERYRPSKMPVAIVTRSGDLPPDLPVFADRTAEHAAILVLTTQRARDTAAAWLLDVAEVVPCGDTEVGLRAAIDALHARGLSRIHCEGGPGLLGDLAALDLIDEFAITLSPMLVGAPGKQHLLTVAGGLEPPFRWRPAHVLEEDGTVFLRLVRP